MILPLILGLASMAVLAALIVWVRRHETPDDDFTGENGDAP